MYTIKEAAAKVGESEHTIRYYCKEGLFPFLTRDKNNVRKFSEVDLEGVVSYSVCVIPECRFWRFVTIWNSVLRVFRL